jgi:hypothetical protein
VKDTRAELQETGIEAARALGDGDRGGGSRAQGGRPGEVETCARGEGMGTERGGRLDVGGCREPPQECAEEGAYLHFAEGDADTAGGATIAFVASFCR